MERLGQVRSLTPQRMKMVALTATATKTVGGCSLFVRENLSYNIGTFTAVSETFKTLLAQLKDKEACPRTIV